MNTNTEQLKKEFEFQVKRLEDGIDHHNKLMKDYVDVDLSAYNYHLGSFCGLRTAVDGLNKIIEEYF